MQISYNVPTGRPRHLDIRLYEGEPLTVLVDAPMAHDYFTLVMAPAPTSDAPTVQRRVTGGAVTLTSEEVASLGRAPGKLYLWMQVATDRQLKMDGTLTILPAVEPIGDGESLTDAQALDHVILMQHIAGDPAAASYSPLDGRTLRTLATDAHGELLVSTIDGEAPASFPYRHLTPAGVIVITSSGVVSFEPDAEWTPPVDRATDVIATLPYTLSSADNVVRVAGNAGVLVYGLDVTGTGTPSTGAPITLTYEETD